MDWSFGNIITHAIIRVSGRLSVKLYNKIQNIILALEKNMFISLVFFDLFWENILDLVKEMVIYTI